MKEFLKDIGKSILKKLIIFGIVLAIIAASIAGCSLYHHIKKMPSRKDAKMYDKCSSYQRYDYHLKCFDKDDYITDWFDIKYGDNGYGYEYSQVEVRFQQISGVNENEFVYSYWQRWAIFGMLCEETILQNPENYIDVLNDWTISQIEFVCPKNENGEIIYKVYSSTNNDKVISDFKNCILGDKTADELKPFSEYEGNYKQDFSNKYIRIHFKESENIIWETEVYRYSSAEKKKDLIYIDVGRETIGFVNNSYVKSQIFKYLELQDWIEESFAKLDAD